MEEWPVFIFPRRKYYRLGRPITSSVSRTAVFGRSDPQSMQSKKIKMCLPFGLSSSMIIHRTSVTPRKNLSSIVTRQDFAAIVFVHLPNPKEYFFRPLISQLRDMSRVLKKQICPYV